MPRWESSIAEAEIWTAPASTSSAPATALRRVTSRNCLIAGWPDVWPFHRPEPAQGWPCPRGGLNVIVERKLVGMGADPQGFDLVGLLVPDPGVDDVRGEDVTAEQEVAVSADGLE